MPNEQQQLRQQVKTIYKALLYLGRDWPQGYSNYFRPKLHAAFSAKQHLDYHNEEERRQIQEGIKRGEYMIKELETFWFLKRYRAIKRSYGSRSGA